MHLNLINALLLDTRVLIIRDVKIKIALIINAREKNERQNPNVLWSDTRVLIIQGVKIKIALILNAREKNDKIEKNKLKTRRIK